MISYARILLPGYRVKPNYGDQRLGANSAGASKKATISKPVQERRPLASTAAEIIKPVVQTIIRAPSASSGSSSGNPSKLTLLQREVADKAARNTISCMMIRCCWRIRLD
jgi:hypothetical protein